ncbi:MAG: 2-C-methyl-D-erythritol 4-phosphate cytidylyltransferase [Bacteroidetes bacterium]|nr:MAG: 2-C-methyl-D-erythritol 4-phosphate cytidylyltransferase [Bacteroidota bacterium]
MQISVIITAGGIGKRFGAAIPKQFVEINGTPLIMHTIAAFERFDPEAEIIVTLPEDWISYWNELVAAHQFSTPVKIVSGGEERYHSVKNALTHCSGEYIFIHDAVRPLVSDETLQHCREKVIVSGAVVPVIEMKESIRMISDQGSVAVKRSDYRIVQTPQCFRAELVRKAYDIPYHNGITDDAGLVEEAGVPIALVDGNEENIKITTQNDLTIATLFLKK